MNIFLKNKILNVVISFIGASILFVAGFIVFIVAAQIVIGAMALFVAGGLGYKLIDWFDEKYIQLNKGE